MSRNTNPRTALRCTATDVEFVALFRGVGPDALSYPWNTWEDGNLLERVNCLAFALDIFPPRYDIPSAWCTPKGGWAAGAAEFVATRPVPPAASLEEFHQQLLDLGLVPASVEVDPPAPNAYLVTAHYYVRLAQVHFCRMDASGQWWHKPGEDPAAPLESGSPTLEEFGLPYELVGYYWVTPGSTYVEKQCRAWGIAQAAARLQP